MVRLARIAAAVLAAGALLAAAPRAQAQEGARPLVIGSTRLFTIRVADTLNGREMSVSERIDHVQDVFAKYLGGQFGKVTHKKWGDRTHLYLNGDYVLSVSPADAAATGYKTTEQLAMIWMKDLQRGFDEAHVLPSGARR